MRRRPMRDVFEDLDLVVTMSIDMNQTEYVNLAVEIYIDAAQAPCMEI